MYIIDKYKYYKHFNAMYLQERQKWCTNICRSCVKMETWNVFSSIRLKSEYKLTKLPTLSAGLLL